jgi:hypothetical protein
VDQTARTERSLHALTIGLATMSVLEEPDIARVRIVVASRSSFTERDARQLERWFFDERVVANAELPELPTRFPQVDVMVRDAKAEPGLQVCDLLLWSAQRGEPDGTQWRQQVGLFGAVRASMPGDPQGVNQYWVGAVSEGHLSHVQPGGRALSELGGDEIGRRLFQMEMIVTDQANLATGSERLRHLGPRLSRAAAMLAREDLGQEEYREVARSFLMILDTAPLYDASIPKEVAAAWELRRVATAIVRIGQVVSIRLIDEWARLRRLRREGRIAVTRT